MSITTVFDKQTTTAATVGEPPVAGVGEVAGVAGADLRQMKPLPAWFFAFEGVFGGAYDILKANPDAWTVLIGLALVNITISLTVLGKRRKLVRAMLKNSRTRFIAIGLIALRLAVHLVLGALGAAVETTTGHLLLAFAMTGITVALLWFDQRVTFRALGIPLSR
ncbi:hypothetical protein ACEZCY_09395 [Streptacidiphilus sp. N1-12]|uniref:Uncharacterized protein n=2 Tax=Streptacidiphilus alkalitolerans TaxID=3342712 RepID=A0ABV6WCH4_9ACTN